MKFLKNIIVCSLIAATTVAHAKGPIADSTFCSSSNNLAVINVLGSATVAPNQNGVLVNLPAQCLVGNVCQFNYQTSLTSNTNTLASNNNALTSLTYANVPVGGTVFYGYATGFGAPSECFIVPAGTTVTVSAVAFTGKTATDPSWALSGITFK